jgi:hypothetical protein
LQIVFKLLTPKEAADFMGISIHSFCYSKEFTISDRKFTSHK